MAPSPATIDLAVLTEQDASPSASPFSRYFPLKWGLPWAWLTLAVSLSVTGMAYHVVETDSKQDALTQFEFRYTEIVDAIDRRMATYTHTLQGALGLFRASDQVSRQEWKIYVETLDLNSLFPGIQGLGYAQWILPEDRQQYEAGIRAKGFPNFRIQPAGSRRIYTSITYLEPFDRRNRKAFGYDMFSQETRRQAMTLARDTGQVTISGKVRLVQEINADVQAGFLMYLPHYGQGTTPDSVDARRAAIQGFVYSPFRMRNLMEGILGPGLPNVRLQIFDGAEAHKPAIMYDSQPHSSHKNPIFSRIEKMRIGQHDWTLRLSSLAPFEQKLDPNKSVLILIAGIMTSLMFFGVLWAFATTRQRAQALAEEMTVALNEHSRELSRSNEELQQFAYVASHDLKAPLRGIDHLATWIEEDLGEKLDGEARENMGLLRGRVRRLETLLDDLLAYSRAGRDEAPIERVIVNDMIAGIFDLLNTERRFELILDTEIATMRTKRSALEQVFINIFSNAIKHHDGTHGTISVTVREQDNHYDFTVADDGPGIPVEHRERVFQMFQTLQPRDNVEGSGMGLAIIRKVVERQGGSIVTEDSPGGRGALFHFSWQKIAEPNGK